jgi:hypothetical protein
LNNLQSFLEREYNRIDKTIYRLERSLRKYAADDCRGDGQRAMLEIQRDHLTCINELLEHVDDPASVQAKGMLRMAVVQREHERSAQQDHSCNGCHSDQWWQTFSRMEYMSYLVNQINHLLLVK